MEKIAVLGLGYVGLPVALALARKFPGTVGFDIDAEKIGELKRGLDRNREVSEEELAQTSLTFTSDPADMKACTFFIVAVPTPVDQNHLPDLSPLVAASRTVGSVLSKGDVVVFESTVYPGVTEEVCAPALREASGLDREDFKLGYSPERINPGDKERTLERITKVIAAEDAETLERLAAVYGAVVDAGLHRASSIKVAEAAKVIENTQRDLNIALMNELAIVFDRMGIRTTDVLAAAGTKWNFLKFRPGLVGGHCIGVDPYYLTMKAQQLGYQPEVILAGRRINDNMGRFIGGRLVKLLVNADIPVRGARVGILGLSFKENVSDVRNSKVPDILAELREFGIQCFVHDPLANASDALNEHGVSLCSLEELRALDGLVLAVPHRAYVEMGVERLTAPLRDGGVFVDVKSLYDRSAMGRSIRYWSL